MRTLIISLAFLTFTPVAFAQCVPSQANDYCIGQPGTTVGGGGTGGGLDNGAGTGAKAVQLVNPLGSGATLPWLVNSVLGIVVRIGSIIVVLMLVYVGFMFVTARGEPGKITTARQALLWTVVGALILLGAQAIAIGLQATVQALSTGG